MENALNPVGSRSRVCAFVMILDESRRTPFKGVSITYNTTDRDHDETVYVHRLLFRTTSGFCEVLHSLFARTRRQYPTQRRYTGFVTRSRLPVILRKSYVETLCRQVSLVILIADIVRSFSFSR